MNIDTIDMSYEERCQIVSDIRKVYPGTNRWRSILFNMPSQQLLAIRQSMTNRGQLNGNSTDMGIHIDVIKQMYYCNTFSLDVLYKNYEEDGYKIYIGRDFKKKDEFGRDIVIQYGIIETDIDWRIRRMNMLGKKMTRYIGMRLNTSFNYFDN